MTAASDVHPARATRLAGPAMMLGAALSNQFGAATGALAFGVIGPARVVAVRQWIAGLVLLAAGRPRWRSFTWAQRRLVLLLAAVYGTMNLSLYSAIGRLGLGLAVTLEFLGPLAVALATSRRRTDLACALVAGAGVIALTRPRPATDYAGIGLALLAAACWASYILLNRQIGRRLPGAQGPAAAAGASALVFLPIGTVVLIRYSADGGRAGVRRRGRVSVLGDSVPARPARAAPDPGRPFRHLHERPPGAGRARGPGRPGPAGALAVLAEHRRHRRRQRGQFHGPQRRGSPAR